MANTIIYAWPPICARGVEFTVEQPISESISALSTDTRYVSQSKPEKSVVTMVISGRNNRGSAGGYINMLKRLLKGGVNLVRLDSKPAHFNLDWVDVRGQHPLEWTSTDRELLWESEGKELLWFTGDTLIGTAKTDGAYKGLYITGAEPNKILAYPDEIVRVGNSTARVLKLEVADENGEAHIRLDGYLPSGEVTIGESESRVYKLVSIPRSVQYAGEDWEYEFNFEEVFVASIRGTYEEQDPWR